MFNFFNTLLYQIFQQTFSKGITGLKIEYVGINIDLLMQNVHVIWSLH